MNNQDQNNENTNQPTISIEDLDAQNAEEIVGGASLSKVGTGQVLLAATNTYTGATTVTQGTMRVA